MRCCAILLLSVLGGLASGQVSVLTQHNDVARTGQNPNETVLKTSNVNVVQFGKLFARTVDGEIYAQPLYVQGLTVGGKTRNVVFVATEHNSVYAFDADDPNAATPLWQVNLGTPVPSSDVCVGASSPYCPYSDLTPQIGITSTPVIDPASQTIYVVAKTKNTINNTYHFTLHALDLLSGTERSTSPVEISTPNFNPLDQNNRPGLLLLNGVVYAAFGSVGDINAWHGWIFGFNASNLSSPPVVFNATPNGCCGGIWGGGGGLAADADNIYAMTGNGNFDANTTGGTDYGDSVLKLSTSTSLGVADYFTPDDQATLFSNDTDLGSGSPLLLPGTSLLVGGGKDGILRLINTNSMGKFNPTFNADVEFQATPGQILGSFVYANSPSFGPAVYLWGPGDKMKAWAFNGSTFNKTPVSQGTLSNAAGETTNAPLSISSNQNQTGTGIIWAVKPAADPGHLTVSGTLYAFDANNLSHLWDSSQNASRDALGNYAKFCPPTIANGKVYVATFSNALVVYGLNPPPASNISFMQVAAATPQSSSAAVPVAYPQAEIAGDLNIVVAGWNDTTSSVSSVTDTLGNTYTLAVGPTTASGLRQSIYYAKNIKGGSNTVTVSFNQAAAYPDIRVLEYAGADTANPLDVTAAAVGASTTANSGSATTTAANDLIFAADTISTGTPQPGAGFAARVITTHDSDLAEDEIAPTPGTYTATAPVSPSGQWVMQMAAFKVQSSGGTPAPTVSSVSPNSGSTNGGTAVTITGTNFSVGATVTFGGTAATNVSVASSTSITATTPAQTAGAVAVAVNTGGQSGTLPNGFTYISPTPTVSSVSPNSGSSNGGTAVTITGTNFAAGATVTFGGTAATGVKVTSSTTITATTPAHAAGAVNVVVTNAGGPSGTLTSGFTYTSSAASQITFVAGQVAAATPQGSFATVSVTYPGAQTAGNLNIVVVGWNDTTSSVSSVTDTLGNTYIQASAPAHATRITQSIYYAKNIQGGSNTVTVKFNPAAAYPDIRVLEYSGANTTSPIDQVAAPGTGSGSTASCGPVSTTAANELILAADTISTGTPSAGTGFAARIITYHDSDLAEDKQAATAGSYSATAPVSPSGYWVIQMVTLKQ